MDANTYQALVERTKSAATDSYHERIGLSAAGIAGEAAELAEVFRDWVLVESVAEYNCEKLLKEAGDVCWYIAHLLTTVDLAFEPVLADWKATPLPEDSAAAKLIDFLISAGKLADYLKKVAFHKIEIDKAKMLERLKPVGRGWLALVESDFSVETVFADNIAKLRVRYPAGFNTADSLARKDGEKME